MLLDAAYHAGYRNYIARNIVANNGFFGVDASLVSRNRILNNGGNGIDAGAGASSLIEKNVVKGNGDGTTTFDLYDFSPTDDCWQKNQYLTESL